MKRYLTYLIVLTSLFTGVTLSKYVTKTTGEDAGRVASNGNIVLTETGDFDSPGRMILQPGVSLEKKALISKVPSEMAEYIFVEVEHGNQWSVSSSDPYALSALSGQVSIRVEDANWTYLTKDADSCIYYQLVPANMEIKDKPVLEQNQIQVAQTVKNSQLKTIQDKGLDLTFSASSMQFDGSAGAGTEEQNALQAWNLVKQK